MKDLTHYFASPPKTREPDEADNLADSGIVGSVAILVIADKNDDKNTEVDSNDNEREGKMKAATPIDAPKKRSRVKIKISSKDSRTRRCDIIESKDDVIDKTPSPFRRGNVHDPKKRGSDALRITHEVSQLSETPNAFKVLMTRTKTVPASNTKRKHPETEEPEAVEKTPKKRAKLLEVDDKPGNGDDEHQNGKKKTKKDPGTKKRNLGKQRRDDGGENNNTKTKHRSKPKVSQSENSAPPTSVAFGKELTPKSKTKWTLRVKLQSHSGDDGAEGDDWNISDEDYIFTPKSKRKLRRSREAGDSKDVKKPVEESEREEIAIVHVEPVSTERPESKNANRGKYRVKKGRNKLKSSESDPGKETRQSLGRNSLANGAERVSDVCVVDTESNPGAEMDENPKILLEKKLAPLFVRKSKPTQAVIEARRTFLQSGIPENVKKVITSEQKWPCNDPGTSSMPFPVVSHVSQTRRDSDSQESEDTRAESAYKRKPDRKFAFLPDSTQFKTLLNYGDKLLPEFGNTDKFVKIERDKFEAVLTEVESRCSEARAVWESVCSTSANRSPKKSPKKRNKKLKLQRKSDPVTAEESTSNLNPTWTCKYKPMTSGQVVGNDAATSKLKNWLSGWRLPSPKDDWSSGDEFYSSDCSSSGFYENNQVAVLLGPHGSGKSASVYAVAEELGYRVLEVNASSRRTGKKILTDFQEATKSHRVKRDQATLVTVKKKPMEKKVPQNSLILIEDVDLIFEEDEGFVSATFQLAANTRRPIVMTCKESCLHLNRMAPQQQFIHFEPATGDRVAALLELISLAESGYRLPRPCLDILLRNGDLRQSLLQLQYILLSGPPSILQLDVSPRATLWQDTQALVYKPAVKSSKKNKKAELVEGLAKRLDSISWVSSLTDVENPVSPPWRRKLNPSLSLLEDFQPYSNSADLGSEIADWLRRASLESGQRNDNRTTNFDSKSHLITKRRVKLGIDLALSQAIPSTLEHRSTAVDYLPVIRTICRTEEERARINTKRGKRFYNYLHGLNLASASSNILAAAGSIFQEKSAES